MDERRFGDQGLVHELLTEKIRLLKERLRRIEEELVIHVDDDNVLERRRLQVTSDLEKSQSPVVRKRLEQELRDIGNTLLDILKKAQPLRDKREDIQREIGYLNGELKRAIRNLTIPDA